MRAAPTPFVAALAQYPIEQVASWGTYAEKVTRWVDEAAREGAKLAVFPEYGAMELASLDSATMSNLAGSMRFVASLAPHIDALHIELARKYSMYILASSMPALRDGRYRNVARFFTPSGKFGEQQKLIMTRFEREEWGISAGGPLNLFDTALGRIGILICYDSEFPLLGRALVEAGAEIILVPSCTDTIAGYHRVRIGAQARALEAQCYVLQSPTIGRAEWSPAVDENHGAAGVFGPPDLGFAECGVEALGAIDVAQWVFGTIDLTKVEEVRRAGAVFNFAHWVEQPGATPLPEVVRATI